MKEEGENKLRDVRRCCLIEVADAVGLVFLGIDYVDEALIL